MSDDLVSGDKAEVILPGTEVLTVEQFALRLQVSRATVFSWIQRDLLKQGIHFFKIGRVLRFPWSSEALKNILEAASQTKEETISRVKPAPVTKAVKKSTVLNLDYNEI